MDTGFLCTRTLGKDYMQIFFVVVIVIVNKLPKIIHEITPIIAFYLTYQENNKK